MKGAQMGSYGVREAVALALLFLASCATSSSNHYRSRQPSVPSWTVQPLTWDKLEHIERWLESPEAARRPEAVPSAELELARGRSDLARRDRGTLSSHLLGIRLGLAEAGFKRVLAHPDSSALDHSRARDGLEALRDLRETIPTPVAGGLHIQPREAWGARAPTPSRLRSNQRPWTRITVHHSATASAAFGGPSADAAAGAIRSIQKTHMNTEGWGDIGYHFLIDPAGRLYQGRSLAWQGAHAGGSNNVGNIGICLLGNFDIERPDPRAVVTLESLIQALSTRHGLQRSSVKGHREYKATVCPGGHLTTWVEKYRRGSRS